MPIKRIITFNGNNKTECLIPYKDKYLYYQSTPPEKISIVFSDENIIIFEQNEGVFTTKNSLKNMSQKQLIKIAELLGGYLINLNIYEQLKNPVTDVKVFPATQLQLNDKGFLLQTSNTEQRKQNLLLLTQKNLANSRQNG